MSHDSLPNDVWRIIGLKLGATDRIRFRAVSKSWMSLTPSRQPPLLLCPDLQETQSRRGFMCIGEEKIYDLHVPDLYKAKCVGSTGNWLVTAHRDETVRLVNPFSKQQFYLPSHSTLKYHEFWRPEICKVVLSSSPSASYTRDCVVMAIHSFSLAIARLGDTNWTTLQIGDEPTGRSIGVQDIIFYKGKFYAITFNARLLVCDILDAVKATFISDSCYKERPFVIGFSGGDWICGTEDGDASKHFMWRLNYLVEWLDKLVLVIKLVDTPSGGELDAGEDYRVSNFLVYEFDFVDGKWKELKSLGEHSLFLGLNTSVSVRASDYHGLVKRNCIYFTEDFTTGYLWCQNVGAHDMGVFDLEDRSIRLHYIGGVPTSLYSFPIWIVPA